MLLISFNEIKSYMTWLYCSQIISFFGYFVFRDYSEYFTPRITFNLQIFSRIFVLNLYFGLFIPIKHIFASQKDYLILWRASADDEKVKEFYVQKPNLIPRRYFENNVPLLTNPISRKTLSIPRRLMTKYFHTVIDIYPMAGPSNVDI